ncbi:MAG: T9SS type A sorting domain-containing protein [Bacteroidetes bacterium]|nr:T9SS type A sorting domain-containing protein [Bacteroidota bacterium]
MNHLARIFILLFMGVIGSHAQTINPEICKGYPLQKAAAKTTVADPAEDNYDIKWVKFDLKMTNLNTSISGSVMTKATVTNGPLSSYVFELNALYTVDSVLINGINCAFQNTGDVWTVSLPNSIPQNLFFVAQVFYHGAISSGSAFFSTGIRTQSSPSWGNMVTYTMSEPYEAKDWWPTKQSLTDKIDSADIWITVPSSLKAGSNGRLQAITTLSGSLSRYEWETKYPIDYYLLSVAVSNYTEYSFYVPFTGTNDSMLVQNYIYNNPQFLSTYKSKIDSVGIMLQYLSKLFGRYPFWKEKYGHCVAPLNGGMEHQTMTTLGNFGTTLSVHELGHQWFGDNVTCGSWQDIWLNEGFASYIEYLFVEKFWNVGLGLQYMTNKHNNILLFDTSTVYVADTTNESRIFDSRFTYDKGASALHTLRFVFNNDSLFFAGLRIYQNQFSGKTAVTADFKAVMQQTLGQNLDTFFTQWIYRKGHPVFNIQWNQVGKTVMFRINQTTSDPSVNYFTTPVEVMFHSPQGDTLVRIYQNQNPQVFKFNWNKSSTGLTVDPNDWLLDAPGSITFDATLSIDQAINKQLTIYPNPTSTLWQIDPVKVGTTASFTDLSGHEIWSKKMQSTQLIIPAQHLPAGIYFLKLNDNNQITTWKLIKQ